MSKFDNILEVELAFSIARVIDENTYCIFGPYVLTYKKALPRNRETAKLILSCKKMEHPLPEPHPFTKEAMTSPLLRKYWLVNRIAGEVLFKN